jgi:hypothetical protein
VTVDDGGFIHAFIDGVQMTPAGGMPSQRGGGTAGLEVKSATGEFDDVALTQAGRTVFQDDFSGGSNAWNARHNETWSVVQGDGGGQTFRGNTLLDPGRLMSSELSPQLDAHFRLMHEAGARQARLIFRWNDIQPTSRDSFYWTNMDVVAIEAHQHQLKLLPALAYAPNWAVAPEFRSSGFAYAFPPTDNADYADFAAAAVRRFKPGGELAKEQGWSDGYGITEYECGAEYNIRDYWNGTPDQFVPYLKACYDAVHRECPDCRVLNGSTADDVIPYYYTARKENIPIIGSDGAPLFNADGSPQVRQHVWQGVADLYDAIRRSPVDKDPDHYFDILNIHSYQWRGLSQGGWAPDSFGSYDFYNPADWRRWYDDRLNNVTAVMRDPALFDPGVPGDADKAIWVTETGFASEDNSDSFRGFLGSEALQAQAVRTSYQELSLSPQVEKVFWWYGWDTDTNTGLLRKDLTPKPAFAAYSDLTGSIPQAPPVDYSFVAGAEFPGPAGHLAMQNTGDAYAEVEVYLLGGNDAGAHPRLINRLTGDNAVAPGVTAGFDLPAALSGTLVVRSMGGEPLVTALRQDLPVAGDAPGSRWRLPSVTTDLALPPGILQISPPAIW